MRTETKADKISIWMEAFTSAWLRKDIDAVFALLADDVAYWETPFEKLGKGSELRAVWEEVRALEHMHLEYNIFSRDTVRDRYGVQWWFTYAGGEAAGTYLIELDADGLCRYFYHTAQSREE